MCVGEGGVDFQAAVDADARCVLDYAPPSIYQKID